MLRATHITSICSISRFPCPVGTVTASAAFTRAILGASRTTSPARSSNRSGARSGANRRGTTASYAGRPFAAAGCISSASAAASPTPCTAPTGTACASRSHGGSRRALCRCFGPSAHAPVPLLPERGLIAAAPATAPEPPLLLALLALLLLLFELFALLALALAL